tara:strand:- start:2460 stop:3152 length:693 start_codon:yes stop_codon:yes gene_type:complete
MKILSIIPARGDSKGIPLKNLVQLNKKPLLYYTVKASLNSKLIDRTIVSTDHPKISAYAQKLQAEVIARPKKLSGDHTSIESVVLHILEYLLKKERYVPDTIIFLQNTSPLRTSTHIDEAIKLFQKKKFDSLLSGYNSHKFFWKKNNLLVKPMNYSPQKRPNRQDFTNQFIENGSIYIIKHDIFKKIKSRLSGKIGLYKMPEILSIEIDTRDDLLLASYILKTLNQKTHK